MAVQYKVGDFVRETGGQEGQIRNIKRPNGFMECHILTTTGAQIIRLKHEIIKKIDTTSRMLKLKPTKRKYCVVEDEEVDDFINKSTNPNTNKKTKYDMAVLLDFIKITLPDETQEIHNMDPEKLNRILARFLVSATKENGENYEPATLRCFFTSFQRHLRQKDYPLNILTDSKFQKARDALAAKQKALKREGKGNLPNKATALSNEEVDQLYDSGQMGAHNPEAIINGLWWHNTTQFGLRGISAHRNMRWGDVSLKRDHLGNEYLE